MHLEVRLRRSNLSGALIDYAQRRLAFAIDRFRLKLGNVTVTLSDSNGPKGGIDSVCRIVAHVSGRGDVVVEAAEADAGASIDVAAHKLSQVLARRVARERKHRLVRPLNFAGSL